MFNQKRRKYLQTQLCLQHCSKTLRHWNSWSRADCADRSTSCALKSCELHDASRIPEEHKHSLRKNIFPTCNHLVTVSNMSFFFLWRIRKSFMLQLNLSIWNLDLNLSNPQWPKLSYVFLSKALRWQRCCNDHEWCACLLCTALNATKFGPESGLRMRV